MPVAQPTRQTGDQNTLKHPEDLSWLILCLASLILLGYTINSHTILATGTPRSELHEFPGIIPESIHWATALLALFFVPSICSVLSLWVFPHISRGITLVFLSIPVTSSLVIEIFWNIMPLAHTSIWAVKHFWFPLVVTILSDAAVILLFILGSILAIKRNTALFPRSNSFSTMASSPSKTVPGEKKTKGRYLLVFATAVALVCETSSVVNNAQSLMRLSPTVENTFFGQTISLGWIGMPFLLVMTLIALNSETQRFALASVLLLFFCTAVATILVRSYTVTTSLPWWRAGLLILSGIEIISILLIVFHRQNQH